MEETTGNSPNQVIQAPPQNPLEKVKEIFSSIFEKVKSLVSRFKVPSQPTEVEGMFPGEGISPRTKKIVTIVAAIFFIIILLLISISYLKNRTPKEVEEKEEGDGAQTTIVERKASRYATDEAVLKMESDIKILEEEINRSDIEEKSLTPPGLNFNVDFKE